MHNKDLGVRSKRGEIYEFLKDVSATNSRKASYPVLNDHIATGDVLHKLGIRVCSRNLSLVTMPELSTLT